MGLLDRLRGPATLSCAQAAADAAAGRVLLVDVREDAEWRAGHASDAVHVPLGTLPGRLEELAGRGLPLAFVCRSGARSARATKVAASAGADAHNVRGGMVAWERAGLPVRRG